MGSIDQPLDGKILLVTGGASGIGLSLTKQAHAIGAKILVADLKTTSDFDSFAAGKSNILYVQSDVTKWSDFDRMFAECEKKWGDVPDAYGICAGLFDPPFSNFWQDPEQEKGYMQVDVNVNHPVKLTRLAMRKSLQRGKRASVCIIASVGGIAGSPPAPLYCATKHAIVGFVKSLATTESLTGVKITSLCPAGVFTPLFDAAKIKQFAASADRYLTADTCAQHLLDLLQKKEYPCGTQLEVTLSGTRVIPEWNVSAPQGDGTGQEAMDEEFLKNLMGPAREACEIDKASAKL